MKNTLLLLLIGLCYQLGFSQWKEVKPFSIEADYFYGSILEHNPDIAHLIIGHPRGMMLKYNRKTYGWNEWESRYNYPDYGVTFSYQDLQNPTLGEVYGLYGHFTFYALSRWLSLTVAQGVAYANNPYDPDLNFDNSAYGSHFLSTTIFEVNLGREQIFKGFGAQLGMGIIHYSNANLKAPNNSTNTLYFSAGINYQPNSENFPARITHGSWRSVFYKERIRYNAAFRTGINEADVNGLGQYPFYVFSFFADKRINYKSTIQMGVDFIFSDFLIHLIRYRQIAFPADGLEEGTDYRRIGVFIGHELRFNRLAFVTQLGKYVYWPYEFEKPYYNRLGMKRYFFENDMMFAAITLRAHWGKAEAVEFGVGIRL